MEIDRSLVLTSGGGRRDSGRVLNDVHEGSRRLYSIHPSLDQATGEGQLSIEARFGQKRFAVLNVHHVANEL